MDPIANSRKIINELGSTLDQIDPSQLQSLLDRISSADRIFVAGAGRSRLMMMAFAMRLMQIGYTVYVVGEIVTPAIGPGDLLIIGSGSGETSGLVLNARKARQTGADLALITTAPESSIGAQAQLIIHIPTSTQKHSAQPTAFQPGGSTFEQSLLLLGDSIVIALMDRLDPGLNVMTLHANLE